MHHLLEIESLTVDEIHQLLAQALAFKKGELKLDYSNHKMATLFYENSTRTRISFEAAAINLKLPVIHFDNAHSSEMKGEIFEDTLLNLRAMGIDLFVIRHKKEFFYQSIIDILPSNTHVINAGDGTHEHPSQALLDLMTIIEKKPAFPRLKIAIVGNISHSRVAKSLQILFHKMNLGELVLIAPKPWLPEEDFSGHRTEVLEEGLKDCDVVICLRVQKERLGQDDGIDLEDYKKCYTLTKSKLSKAKSDVVVMHPGPLNRGLEIESEVADGSSSLILEQVKNGVFMRIAIINTLLSLG